MVVRDRLNPNEVKDLIDRLAEAAKRTNGTFTFRNEKLFGNLILIVNKCQVRNKKNHELRSKILIKDISRSDEAALETLMENNPSLMKKIHQYFSGVPQVVLLPNLQWDFELYPDFNEDGFYLNYDHILTAHPPLRDRMLYGLRRLASLINLGVSNEESYFIKCENFENLVESVYNCKPKLLLKSCNIIFQLLQRM